MPHAVFQPGQLSATADTVDVRHLVPGVEPGGSRAGKDKPALLLRDAWAEFTDGSFGDASDLNSATWFLKLSQESSLNPGLILPVGQIGMQRSSAGAGGEATDVLSPFVMHDLFRAQGTLWAPSYVGIRFVEAGTIDVGAVIHVDYEVVLVPWRDWFIMWEFLDGIVDNSREY